MVFGCLEPCRPAGRWGTTAAAMSRPGGHCRYRATPVDVDVAADRSVPLPDLPVTRPIDLIQMTWDIYVGLRRQRLNPQRRFGHAKEMARASCHREQARYAGSFGRHPGIKSGPSHRRQHLRARIAVCTAAKRCMSRQLCTQAGMLVTRGALIDLFARHRPQPQH